MRIGVLAVQGAFEEHISILKQLGVEAVPVRLPHQLAGLDGLIIPGGESTSISRLISRYNLLSEITDMARDGLPILGTCAGMILMSNGITDDKIKSLGMMDIKIKRNAFGRQRESFEAELLIPVLGDEPFPGVFIRAPIIEQANGTVEIITSLADGTSVAARQGKLFACALHPELTNDLRFHKYFLDIIAGQL